MQEILISPLNVLDRINNVLLFFQSEANDFKRQDRIVIEDNALTLMGDSISVTYCEMNRKYVVAFGYKDGIKFYKDTAFQVFDLIRSHFFHYNRKR